MDELEIILANSSLSMSIEWIQTKIETANRKQVKNEELIQSMQYQLAMLKKAYSVYRGLVQEYRVSRQRNLDLEFAVFQYKMKNDELEKDKRELLNLI
jgi:hypothetical protein